VPDIILWHRIIYFKWIMLDKAGNAQMSAKDTACPVLWEKEPLMRLLAGKFTPASLGIWFFICISMSLCIAANLFQPEFFDNISWSISIVFLFPFLFGFSYKYYQEIPKLFDHLFDDIVLSGSDNRKSEFYKWLDVRVNNYAVTILIFIFSLSITLLFFYQKKLGCEASWMINGDRLRIQIIGNTYFCALTGVGLYAAFIQLIITYWCMNLAFRAAICYWGLYEFFENRKKWNFQIKINVLHPDRCAGLGRIGDVAMLFNIIIFIIGVYVSLTVFDKMLLQKSDPLADFTVPLYLGGYVLLAPMMFFLPLGSARLRMKEAKIDFLRPISERCEQLAKLSAVGSPEKSAQAVRDFFEMDKLRIQIEKEIPVWPFNLKSFLKFSGAIVFPIMPPLVTFAGNFIGRFFPG
jgi:hypothetical protein